MSMQLLLLQWQLWWGGGWLGLWHTSGVTGVVQCSLMLGLGLGAQSRSWQQRWAHG